MKVWKDPPETLRSRLCLGGLLAWKERGSASPIHFLTSPVLGPVFFSDVLKRVSQFIRNTKPMSGRFKYLTVRQGFEAFVLGSPMFVIGEVLKYSRICTGISARFSLLRARLCRMGVESCPL